LGWPRLTLNHQGFIALLIMGSLLLLVLLLFVLVHLHLLCLHHLTINNTLLKLLLLLSVILFILINLHALIVCTLLAWHWWIFTSYFGDAFIAKFKGSLFFGSWFFVIISGRFKGSCLLFFILMNLGNFFFLSIFTKVLWLQRQLRFPLFPALH